MRFCSLPNPIMGLTDIRSSLMTIHFADDQGFGGSTSFAIGQQVILETTNTNYIQQKTRITFSIFRNEYENFCLSLKEKPLQCLKRFFSYLEVIRVLDYEGNKYLAPFFKQYINSINYCFPHFNETILGLPRF